MEKKDWKKLSKRCWDQGIIDPELYTKYDVKRGLRDQQGKGVLTGLTRISEINSSRMENGVSVPMPGELFYRGYRVEKLIDEFVKNGRYGFEEITWLLLFGTLPTKEEYEGFCRLLGQQRHLPGKFVRDVIMKAPANDMMNGLQRSVLMLYSYDKNPDDVSLDNVLRQCVTLIAQMPLLAVYSYQTYRHYKLGRSLIIRNPDPRLSTAENILRMLRPDGSYTELEAKVLDVALVLHAEHGGGNNSSFTTHVVSSSGTDTYSAIAASLGSLKGPKHGGANNKVVKMFDDLHKKVVNLEDEEELQAYFLKLLRKEGFDKSGLIYGMGHAVYSVSDPRAGVLKRFAEKLAQEKGLEAEFALYDRCERIAAETIYKERKIYKGVSANVDFYSGFVYRMLGLPMELFTPIFAVARISGWSAHRLEELMNCNKIIRPAYMSVSERKDMTE